MLGFLATGGATGIDYSAITDALTQSLTSGQVAALIGVIIGASIAPALMWFGGRKILSSVMKAFKKGKISF